MPIPLLILLALPVFASFSADSGLEEEILKFSESSDDRGEDLPLPNPKTGVLSGKIPFEFNKRVESWIKYFTGRERARFQRYLNRGLPYRNVVEDILEANRVPAELFYLGLIESGFSLQARSRMRAVGIWQFMKPTATLYGLRVGSDLDERLDPIRSTEAAARHLRDLRKSFGSWSLALAAYNAGVGRIRSAVRKGKSRDFWELVRKKVLPPETMQYIPKFHAARWVGEHLAEYGFSESDSPVYPDVESVRIPSGVTFAQLESIAQIPKGSLKFANPQILRDRIPSSKRGIEIWVPEPHHLAIRAKYEQILEQAENDPNFTRVLKGETLKHVADRSRVSISYLRRINSLKSDRIREGQRLKIKAKDYHAVKPRKKKRKR
jgi:membrane-bound lytic murein transglycosylase D